jgi:YD repeat-containing protein
MRNSASVTVTIPLVVTVQGQTHQPYPNLPVYAFDGDNYTGYNGTTDASGHVTFTLPQGSYHFRADFDNVQFWSNTPNDCTLPGCTAGLVTLPGGTGETTTTIDYTYDPLYRLTAADYSTGDSYRYAYDSVGNRLQQQTSVNSLQSTVNYHYDVANRLAGVDNVNYAWDANGNLLSDGTNDYTYGKDRFLQ